MNIVKAHIRCEGTINRFWTVTYEDGSTESFSSIEGTPRYSSTDEYVHETSESLSAYLDYLADYSRYSDWDEDCDIVEFTLDCSISSEEGLIGSYKITKPDGTQVIHE